MRTVPGTVPLESTEQITVVKMCSYMYYFGRCVRDYLVASQAGMRASSLAQAHKLKCEGMQKGFPDLFLCIPAGGYHGLFIEMKRAKKSASRVSFEQKEWIEKLQEMGYAAFVAYGATEALQIIRDYLGLFGSKKDAS